MKKYEFWLSKAASDLLNKLSKADMTIRNNGRALVWLLITATIPVAVRSRASDVKVIVSFCRSCSKLARKSGMKYLVLYLKASQVLLQQAVGGHVLPDTRPLKVAVSRSRSGYPRIIPREHRLLIKSGSRRIIRFWMTLLGVYRVLSFKGVVSTATIENDGKVISGGTIIGFQRFIHDRFYVMASGTWGRNALLDQAMIRNRKGKFDLWTSFARTLKGEMFEIAKSSPTAGAKWHDSDVSTSDDALGEAAVRLCSSKHSFLKGQFDKWCVNTSNTWITDLVKVYSAKHVKHSLDDSLGRLALKEEAAGKIRVFAMVDAYTQWALYPLHKNIMQTLSFWGQDGTFDQVKPLKALLKKRPKGLWSYDLSAATDRLPLQFQKIVLQPILGIHGAEVWGDILTKRGYLLTEKPPREVFYKVGQPMGAYSSWAMLALTHHALVQWSFYRVCIRRQTPYTWFTLYAVLGDDIVIGDSEVAAEYLNVMTDLGVEIGLAKSLVSPNRLVGEFAKRFFIPGEATMIPIKEVIAARYNITELIQFVCKYKLNVTDTLSFMGFGYKVKGSLNKEFSKLGSRARNQLLMLQYASPLGVGLKTFLTLIGWGRLGPKLTGPIIARLVSLEVERLTKRVTERSEREWKIVFKMMQVKRDHGQRENPYDYLYDRYPAVVKKLDGYLYELNEIKAALKSESSVRRGLEGIINLQDLERRFELLPKPNGILEERTKTFVHSKILKPVRLWRQARVAGHLVRQENKET